MSNTNENRLTPEIVITSHANADFDAFSAMVAAGKLYPEAELVAPYGSEKQRGNYFTDSISYFFDFRSPKDCDLSKVKLLVMVDTRQRSRVPQVETVFANPDLKIHVYDHHPDSTDDVKADLSIVREWGSATAIIASILQEKGVKLTPDEATMLGLGIYEDTGNFTFSSTTEHDLYAGAWLRSMGMDLDVISSLAKSKFTSMQVQILSDLLDNATTQSIRGVSVVLTHARLEVYVDDVAELVTTMMEMEQIKVIFALIRMGDRLQLIARSTIPDKVDVSKICAAFGGGGHSSAASAAIKDKTIAEVQEEISVLLVTNISRGVIVRDKMTPSPKVVEAGESIKAAEAMMLHYGLKAAPVVENNTMHCIGFLEYQTAAKAISHNLGKELVAEYMDSKINTVHVDSHLYPAIELILSQRQRLVPIVDGGDNVVGVLTRTDVVNMMVDDSIRFSNTKNNAPAAQRTKNVRDAISDLLPLHTIELLEHVGKLADSIGISVYAVGGFVRDLFLHERNLDIDLTVEGDGISFARSLSVELNGRVRTHPKFQTAIVIYTDDFGKEQRIDVATARLEYYESPGALPTVEHSSVKMDLYRRDFTINALAIQLNMDKFGDVVDFFGGQRDIKEKNIRVMHSLSFIEDPTRILRAIRFEKRFDFRIVQHTEKLIKNCLRLNMLEKFSGSRLFNELKHVFDEKNPIPCLRRIEQLDLWSAMHPLLRLNPQKEEFIVNAEEVISWYNMLFITPPPQKWMVYMMAMCIKLKYQEMSSILERFNFSDKARIEFLQQREAVRKVEGAMLDWKKKEGRPSELCSILNPISLEGLLVLMAKHHGEDIKRDLSHYISRLRHIALDISGQDIIAIGGKSGEKIGAMLKEILEAKIDEKVATREDQINMAFILMAQSPNEHRTGTIDEVLSGRT